MANETLKLKINTWNHTCGDGCCTTWGTDVFINNELVSNGDYDDIRVILEEVLIKLGYEVIIEY